MTKRYEDMLRPVMEGKQRAARSFAGSFAPKTRWGIYLRNRITALMSQPFVAKFFMGKLLTDPIALPDYPGASGPPLSGRSGSRAAQVCRVEQGSTRRFDRSVPRDPV